MADALGKVALRRWRANPISFITEVLHDPETGKPFELNDAECEFLAKAFELDHRGRLKHPELVFAAIKKSGKTALAAMILLTMVLLFGGSFAEGIVVANEEPLRADQGSGHHCLSRRNTSACREPDHRA
jgi:hypothetical protein